ncbi:FAD-binding protein [Gordonibacter sp.]|uniref:FAD-binding protein n=2 Tax=Gordonibacter sp. TaxID=1968902 RepID=UPI002FCA8AC9
MEDKTETTIETSSVGRKVSRRDFLVGAALAGVGTAMAGAITGCASPAPKDTSANKTAPEANAAAGGAEPTASGQPAFLTAPDPIPDSEIVETVDCDIVICGAGICGLPAAMLAAENGAKVHVLEKGSSYGIARLCTAGFNSGLQTKLNLTTDREEFITSTWAISNGVQGRMSSYGLWFDNSGPYIDWLESVFNEKGYQLIPAASLKDYKITNDGIDMPGASPLWQAFAQMIFFADSEGKFFATGGKVDWTGIMEEYATEKGATFHYSTPAVQLVLDDSGRCTGVIAKNESEEYIKYNAAKGVLLTTGDMAADREMMEHYNVTLGKIIRYNINTNDTGDGQKMGIWIGADMDEFACGDLWPFAAVMMDGTLPTTFDGTHFYAGVANLPMLMVDGAGRRLMAENLPFQSPSIPKLTCTPDGCAWTIWDSAWESKVPQGGYMVEDYTASNTQEEVDKNVANGVTFKFDTIEELGKHCGFDKDIFAASFKRYNDLCAGGKDLDFYKDPLWMTAIDTPPFYASKHCSSMTSTRGGLKNDERCRVLDKKGLPIPGLYAAGNTAGSFYGNVYPPNVMGSGIGHGQCFAWLAVKDILGMDFIHANI